MHILKMCIGNILMYMYVFVMLYSTRLAFYIFELILICGAFALYAYILRKFCTPKFKDNFQPG